MSTSQLSLASAVVGAVCALAAADTTCNSFITANPGLPVPFCDDFDTYCQNPPAWPDACPGGTGAAPTPMRQLWSNSSWNHNTNQYCGAEFAVEEGTTILQSPPYGGRSPNGGDEHGTLGQETVDLITCTGLYGRKGNPDPNHHKCKPLSNVYGSGVSAVTGTDTNPLVLTFTMSGGIQAANKLPWSTGYLELALDDNPVPVEGQYSAPRKTNAPMDYVWVGAQDFGETCASCYGLCGPNNGVHVPWRTICQQEFRRTVAPGTCPDLDTVIRPVLAIGANAELDNNPCHCELVSGSQQPQNYHLSYFDGSVWRVLKTGMGGPGSVGDFNLGDKITSVTLIIKSTTVDIHMVNNKNGYNDWAYGLPRMYTGGFNKLRGGAAAGCELESSGQYRCKQPGNGKKCLVEGGSRCDGGGYQVQNSGYVAFDNVLLYGGEGVTQSGSCCHEDGTCTDDVFPAACAAPGDLHGGPNSHCGETSCCPRGSYTWADADTDHDVDADDFGVFQRCITGSNPPGGIPAGCECFDRAGSAAGIDEDDFAAFEDCVTGPGVPWAPTVDCPANSN